MPSMISPVEAKFINDITCKNVVSSENARKKFLAATSWNAFQNLMTCVVLNKIPSPIYDFEDVDVEIGQQTNNNNTMMFVQSART